MKNDYTLKKNTKNNTNTNTNINTNTNTKTKKLNYLKGGKYLGSGSYGCVITPPLDCKKSYLSKKMFKTYANANANANNTKYVSKIIKQGDSDSYHEINISKYIKKFELEKKLPY